MKNKIIIGIILMLCLINTAYAWSNSTLYNGTSYNSIENLTYRGNQSYIRNLTIPQGAYITNAYLNLTGNNYSFYDIGLYNTTFNYYWNFNTIISNKTSCTDNSSNITIYNGLISNIGISKNGTGEFDGETTYASVDSNSIGDFNGTDNFTFSIWVYFNDNSTERVIFSKMDGTLHGTMLWTQGARLQFYMIGSWPNYEGTFTPPGTITYTTGKWSHIVVTHNSTSLVIYHNGTNASAMNGIDIGGSGLWENLKSPNNPIIIGARNSTGPMTQFLNDSYIDEFRIYNYSLTPTDVANLYNESKNRFENVSLTIGNNNVWNFTSAFNQSNNKTSNLAAIVNSYLNATYLIGTNYIIPFIFNAQTYGILQYSGLLFNNDGFTENSQTYNSNVQSGNYENFQINLTYDSTSYPNINAYLIYNGTSYLANKIGSGNNLVFNRSIIVPNYTSAQTFGFYWNISLINSTGTFYYNSTNHTQTTTPIFIDNCSAYTSLILNYTIKDEITQARINETIYNSSMQMNLQIYSYDQTNLLLNMSGVYNSTSNLRICMNESLLTNTTYSLYVQLKYSADGYSSRYNYLQGFLLRNSTVPQNITLFILESAKSTQFQMTYKDVSFNTVPGALINIAKKFIGEDVYKTVEIERTDDYGRANAYFDLSSNNLYKIVISKDGQNLTVFDEVSPYCNDYYKVNCPLNLNAGGATEDYTDYATYQNINLNPSFNETTRIYTLSFNTLDNSVSNVSIELVKLDNYQNVTLCTNSVLTSSGELTCTIAANLGNFTFIAKVSKDGEYVGYNYYSLPTYSKQAFSGNIVIFGIAVVLLFGCVLLPSAIGAVIGGIIGTCILFYLFLSGNALLGAGFFLALIIFGGIIIWRLRQGGSD